MADDLSKKKKNKTMNFPFCTIIKFRVSRAHIIFQIYQKYYNWSTFSCKRTIFSY